MNGTAARGLERQAGGVEALPEDDGQQEEDAEGDVAPGGQSSLEAQHGGSMVCQTLSGGPADKDAWRRGFGFVDGRVVVCEKSSGRKARSWRLLVDNTEECRADST